ncbi:[protein-PII] uridylyltransferase [Streptomyces sp. HNM0574]|uniref:[protein-PII] uridylyltransferase n=1 Tax=Streptomyces sp. HNM0574 TaxID=2714954 RepID=UPI00146E7F1B|nr:[protein-PII] uridylyltransferase [Streptomyces sp. HNM0574]
MPDSPAPDACPPPEDDDYATARTRLLRPDGGAADGTGAARRAALARLTDRWLAGLLGERPGIALVAVGGYGRGALSPRSDLDLLLLHDGRTPPGELAAVADRVWYPVWDLGIALDHSVRTHAQARDTADADLKAQLGLLDARHVAGDATLTAALRTETLARWRAHAPRRLPALRELAAERTRLHGELRFLLEPDLKEAHGGLRDATALRAVAASWLADAPREGLAAAHDTLLDIRDTLHLATGRATDRLALQDQPQIAAALDLPDADALLHRVYRAAGTLAHASEVTWREVGRVLRARARAGRPAPVARTPLADGVVEHDGEAVLARTARPGLDPVLPLRAAAAAARAGLPLARPAVRRLATAAAAPGARTLPVPWPPEAREQLVTLLGAGEATVPVWEALDAEGLITRLLPDWERVRCRPQRNPVHRWTVDRHLIETAVRAAAAARDVRRPDLLLVAALLHDLGKGWPGDHSVTGATIARDTAARIGYGHADAELLARLVRHHLLLAETATRRDLDDPQTVRAVADAVRDPLTLDLLHALTRADALATGPAAWSAWRAALVDGLVRRTHALLAGDPPAPPSAPAAPTPAAEHLAAEARRTGGPALTLSAAGEPGSAELAVAVPERPGLLSAVAGLLALHRLTVHSAELRVLPARRDAAPVQLLTWRVAAALGAPPDAARLRADLVRALDGSLDVPGRLAAREAAYRRPRHRTARQAPPPRVTAPPGTSRLATVLEVRAEDAPGLLHRIGRALETAGVTVRSAHVSTLGGNAVDAFYVTGPDGAPLPPEGAAGLAAAVRRALAPDRG